MYIIHNSATLCYVWWMSHREQVILLCLHHHSRRLRPNITLNNTPLRYSENPVYLGVVLDPALCYIKHIDYIIEKARKRLNILRAVSGKTWGANAGNAWTFRASYNAILKPVLDYAVPVFHHAARSHQDKLARIQLQAARLITGLWRRTPTDIILIEADLIPINSEQHLATTKYMGKLRSLENHKTADLVKYWWSPGRPRIKKTSLLHSYRDRDIMLVSIPPSQPPPTNPLQAIPNITCADNTDPPINVKKADVDPLTLLSKALMTIEKMPSSAILIYTDGSTLEDHSSGSGVYIEIPGSSPPISLSIKNWKHTNNYAAELIANIEGLQTMIMMKKTEEIYILTDCKSSVQTLSSQGNPSPLIVIHTLRPVIGYW